MADISIGNFSVEYLKVICSKANENAFFSPLSIFASFSMLLLGAKNNSSKEIMKTLHLDKLENQSEIHQEVQSLLKSCEVKNEMCILSIANGLFTHNSFKLLDDFVKGLDKNYKAEMESVDFMDAKSATNKVNKWIESKTNNKIKDMFSPSSFSSMTRLVLANAVYFKGQFRKQFELSQTKKAPFFVTPQKQVMKDMMFNSDDYEFAQDSTIGLKIIYLSFEQSRFSLIIGLPIQKHKLNEALTKLNGDNLLKLMNSTKNQAIKKLQVPRFKLTTKMDLTKSIPELGIVDVFSGTNADLTGISGQGMFVETAIHQTFLDVNEHGVEAAAATGMSIALMCAPMIMDPPIDFIVDEPFLVAIANVQSGAIVFMGKIIDP